MDEFLSYNRELAISEAGRLSQESDLKDIVLSRRDESVRHSAVCKIKDIAWLEGYCAGDESYIVRRAIVRKSENEAFLRKRLIDDSSKRVCEAVITRLEELGFAVSDEERSFKYDVFEAVMEEQKKSVLWRSVQNDRAISAAKQAK